MCILYKYIYITSITFLVLFEHVSANTDFVDIQNPILPCLLHYTYHAHIYLSSTYFMLFVVLCCR